MRFVAAGGCGAVNTPSRPTGHDEALERRELSPVSGARRVATLACLLLLALAMSGCSGPTPTPPTTSPETTVADPDAVLNELAAQLRRQLDALTAGLKTTSRGVTGNSSGACGTPTHDRWPRQQAYGQRLFLTEVDSRPTARRLADKLRADGWSIRTDTDTSTDLELTAQREGAVVFIGAGSTQGATVINGTTACVNADGTVDHRPIG
jgi:hypothetical protein